MHFVLQKLSSLNKRSTEDLGISNSSEMMSALLIFFFFLTFYITANDSDKNSMSATSWVGQYGFTEEKKRTF